MTIKEWFVKLQGECDKIGLPKLINAKFDGPRIDFQFADVPTKNCFVIVGSGSWTDDPKQVADWYKINRPGAST